MNPNETRGADLEEDDVIESCRNCGRDASEWTGRRGQGYRKDDQSYCCEGCADGTGCMCEEVNELGSSPSSGKEVTTNQPVSEDQPSGLSGIGAKTETPKKKRKQRG